MFISKAYAQAVETATDVAVPHAATGADATVIPTAPPTAMEAFMWNMGMVGVMVALFYVLLIRPQQRRFKEHSVMLQGLKKGDKVVTGGGLIGTIESIKDGSDEVVVALGDGMKVTAVRSTLQNRTETLPNPPKK